MTLRVHPPLGAAGNPVRLNRPPVRPWGCPNSPPCGHYWHDVEDFDDPVPMCCHEGCLCGKTAEHRRLRHELLYGS